jgi:hypothetical protein
LPESIAEMLVKDSMESKLFIPIPTL